MSNERKVAQEMAVVIERIVSAERSDADAFIKLQNKRLRQLQEIQRRKDEGKTIQRGKIVLELRASGIIDESGNLAKPYSKGKGNGPVTFDVLFFAEHNYWFSWLLGTVRFLTPSISGKVPIGHLLDNEKVPNQLPEIGKVVFLGSKSYGKVVFSAVEINGKVINYHYGDTSNVPKNVMEVTKYRRKNVMMGAFGAFGWRTFDQFGGMICGILVEGFAAEFD